MLDGIFVLDNVIHIFDMSDKNLRDDETRTRAESEEFRKWLADLGAFLRWPAFNRPGEFNYGFYEQWSIEAVFDMVFVVAPTDMAMAQVVPIYDWFNDGYAPVNTQAAMAKAYPDRVLFCGGVDPVYRGLQDAIDHLESQVKELGACSIKFYNGHVQGSWACDDEKLAYPLYEKCRDLGISVLQFHKGFPLGKSPYQAMNPLDLEQPARDFPDLNFVIHHLALPFFDEAISLAGRFPNVYLALSGNLNAYIISPRLVQEQMGRLLMEVGVDKLFYGSEAALNGSPAPYLKAFLDFEIPEDLRRGYGYPQITRDDKEKILGLNFARLMGIDVEQKRTQLEESSVYDPERARSMFEVLGEPIPTLSGAGVGS
jgi:predicted TIM-barrel fold metal-dependent hydrolase